MKKFLFFLITALVSTEVGITRAAGPADREILLEDFIGVMRTTNADGGPVFRHYHEGGPGTMNFLNDVTAPRGRIAQESVGTCDDQNGGNPYPMFLDYSNGYPWPQGYLQTWIKSGTWDPNVNRLRFWVRSSKTIARRADGGSVIEFGTYVKAHNNPDPNWQGEHYYHIMDTSLYADRWMLVEINRTPQHQVGNNPSTNWGEDPTMASQSVHYFDGMTLFYPFDGVYCLAENATFDYASITLGTVTGEPDALVASLTAVYTGSQYEVNWAAPKNSVTDFDVRYSPQSMKGVGFASGTDGGRVSSPGSAYTGTLWQSLAMPENAQGLYIAIRPVGGTNFTEIYLPNLAAGVPPNSPPTATLTNPSNGAIFTAPASISMSATASDTDGTVSKVEFFANGNLVGTDATNPYNFTWTSVPAGTYDITAKATDDQAAQTISSAVRIDVQAPNGSNTNSSGTSDQLLVKPLEGKKARIYASDDQTVDIFDRKGKKVATLKPIGGIADWDGSGQPSGTYICKTNARRFKIVLIR